MGKKGKQLHAKNTRIKVRAKAVSKPSASSNPYEVRQARKVDSNVVNRRVRGANRNVAQARSKAFEKRKNTLLVDYHNSKKSNEFIDRRWGANDPTVAEEEKHLVRFKKAKLHKYNRGATRLDDGAALGASKQPNSSVDLLTHGGRSLDEHLDLDSEFRHDSDDEEDKGLNRELTQAHFGGGSFDSRRTNRTATEGKTQKEILMDTILKSKEKKMDKKRDKDQMERDMEDLDSLFDGLLEAKDLRFKPSKGERLPKEEYVKQQEAEKEAEAKDAFGEFGSLVKQLAFESRAKATDRTLTPEEKALEDRKRLEALENERLKRMGGVTSDSDGDDDDDDDDELGTGNSGSKVARRRALKKRRNAKAQKEAGGVAAEGKKSLPVMRHNKGSSYEEVAAGAAMPYILDCPDSYESFRRLLSMDWVQGLDDEMTLVERICMSNSVKLGNGENAGKMEKFLDTLVRWWCHPMSSSSAYETEGGRVGGGSECFDRFHRLSAFVYQLTQQMPKPSGRVFRAALSRMQVSVQQRIMRSSETAMACDSWPSFPELAFLQYIPQFFPPSDFEHSVVTPAYILISQCLTQCPIRNAKDLASGLFCAGLHFTYATEALRLVPEGLGFLQCILIHIAAAKQLQGAEVEALMDKVALPHIRNLDLKWLRQKASHYKHAVVPSATTSRDQTSADEAAILHPPSPSTTLHVPFSAFFTQDDANSANGEEGDAAGTAASMVSTTLKLVRESVALYAESPGFPELFAHILDALELGDPGASPALPEPLFSQWKETQSVVQKAYVASRKARMSLQLHAQQPVAIRTLEPAYDLSYTVRKDKDENVDKVRTKQLQREIKREKRGAVRELRKDNEFLAAHKFEERMMDRDQKKNELKRNRSWLDEQVRSGHTGRVILLLSHFGSH
jgi:nucleolar protein 14